MKKHPDKVCDNTDCSENNCDKIHPNPCKWGYRCGHNRKGSCLYSHVTIASDDGKLEALKKEFEKKFEVLEVRNKEIENNLKQKDKEIKQMSKKFQDLEASFGKFRKEYVEIEERVTETLENNQTFLNESISVLGVTEKKFNCSKCNFNSESERGLKVHIKRKHELSNDKDFPQMCEFCDHECSNKSEMEKHLKEHSYRVLKFKCEDCDYFAPNQLSLEIHAGKTHSGNFECALCEFKGKDVEDLETHLHTCQKFICDCRAKLSFSNLPDLKSHLSSQHKKDLPSTYIELIQMDRQNSENISIIEGLTFF